MERKIIAKSRLGDFFKKNYKLDIVWMEKINSIGCDKSKAYFGVLIAPGTQLCYNFRYLTAVDVEPVVASCSDTISYCMDEMKKQIATYLHSMGEQLELQIKVS